MIDAVISTGGKQYRVHEGSVLNVATVDAEPGSLVELRDILLVSNDGSVTVGTPTVDGAFAVAEVVEHGKGKKVINFKYKAKVRYRRKRGHRQAFTTLAIKEITANGVTVKAPEPSWPPAQPERPAGFAGRVEETPVAAAPAQEPVAAAPAEEPVAEATEAAAESAEAPETPAPRTRRRRRTAEIAPSEDEAEE